MSIHSGQPRSLSLHQTQPTVSAGQKLVVGTEGKSGHENLGWITADVGLHSSQHRMY